MKPTVSVIMITKNAESTIGNSLNSVYGWTNEIIVVDSFSKDQTANIAERYSVKLYRHQYEGEGSQRSIALSKAKGEWILVLDADEVVTLELKKEILKTIKSTKFSGFNVPIQSHFGQKKLNYGGENYKKMILFKRKVGYSTSEEIHAVCKVRDNKVSDLKNKLDHYSYLSFYQTLKKFTNYAIRMAKQKSRKGENSSFKKIFTYPFHMFWARFVKDKGYKDGIFRIPLDLGFAYMEFLTYFILFFKRK